MEGSDFFDAHAISRKFNESMANYVPSEKDEEDADAAVAAATRNNAAAEQDLRRRKRGKKEAELPKAPKMHWTAYAFFMEEYRNSMKDVDPKPSFGEVSKVASAMWKALSAEERRPYEAMAEADKQRFEEEMKSYVPPYDASEEKEEEEEVRRLQAPSAAEEDMVDPRRKVKKSPFAPKGPLSAYFIFTNHIRPMVVLERPDLSLPEVTKEIASRWRALSLEEKAPYEEKSLMDKRRYQMEMAAFKAGMM